MRASAPPTRPDPAGSAPVVAAAVGPAEPARAQVFRSWAAAVSGWLAPASGIRRVPARWTIQLQPGGDLYVSFPATVRTLP